MTPQAMREYLRARLPDMHQIVLDESAAKISPWYTLYISHFGYGYASTIPSSLDKDADYEAYLDVAAILAARSFGKNMFWSPHVHNDKRVLGGGNEVEVVARGCFVYNDIEVSVIEENRGATIHCEYEEHVVSTPIYLTYPVTAEHIALCCMTLAEKLGEVIFYHAK